MHFLKCCNASNCVQQIICVAFNWMYFLDFFFKYCIYTFKRCGVKTGTLTWKLFSDDTIRFFHFSRWMRADAWRLSAWQLIFILLSKCWVQESVCFAAWVVALPARCVWFVGVRQRRGAWRLIGWAGDSKCSFKIAFFWVAVMCADLWQLAVQKQPPPVNMFSSECAWKCKNSVK